jgi:hypothetical protein
MAEEVADGRRRRPDRVGRFSGASNRRRDVLQGLARVRLEERAPRIAMGRGNRRPR